MGEFGGLWGSGVGTLVGWRGALDNAATGRAWEARGEAGLGRSYCRCTGCLLGRVLKCVRD